MFYRCLASSEEEHKNPKLPTLQCLSFDLQWLPPVLGISIQSAYPENPDPLFSRRLHVLHCQLAAFWFQGSSGYLQTNLAHPPPCSPSKKTHLVPSPSQEQVRQDYLDRFIYLTHSRSFHRLPPGGSSSLHLGVFLVPVFEHFIINLNLFCFLSVFLHVGQSS
ncbi:hypothetical protein AMECASPLE_022515 [Ameca splendens]|uniref:Uncharacterized protein n=1 Tax=Ameca splendens TaxID=208324 RepID=A0ABV0YQQ3_9TELE